MFSLEHVEGDGLDFVNHTSKGTTVHCFVDSSLNWTDTTCPWT